MSLKFINLFILFFFSLLAASPSYAIDTPSSCRGVDLNRYMHTGQPASAPPDKIYKFTEMRAQLLRSIDNSQNTQCYADFYRQAIGEVGDYWGERLAQSGCEVDNRGRITGSCPDAGEARRSVEFVGNLDRELKTRIRARLAESQQAREAAAAAADRDDCEARPTTPARSAQEIKDALCCGTASGGGGVIRAVERGINYQSCIGKTRPTSQSFLSGSGLASCVGNAVKAALQQLWDNITAIFSLPGELWAARSQIWALITQPQARAQFARMLMQQFRSFFTDRVEAFKCYNDYEKAQYVCRMGGQLIATFATPSTIGSFLRLATQPAAAALRAMSAMLSRSPGGGRIMAGIERANTAARSAAAAATRAGRAVDEASGGRISATARTAGRVGDAIGRPLSAPIERIARSIEGSATFQRLFVNSFRAEKASMGDARPNLAARPDVLEGEVLPPEPRRAAAPSDAPQLERGQIIEGDYVRVVDDAPAPAAAARIADNSTAADAGPVRLVDQSADSPPRLNGPETADLPRLPAPDNSRSLTVVDDAPAARVPDRTSPSPNSSPEFSDGPSRAPPPAQFSLAPELPRLPAPIDTPRLPVSQSVRATAPPSVPPASRGSAPDLNPSARISNPVATPDSPTVNLNGADTRVPSAAPRLNNGGGVTGFSANATNAPIPVGSVRTISPSQVPSGVFSRAGNVDSPRPAQAASNRSVTQIPPRNLDSDATVKMPTGGARVAGANPRQPATSFDQGSTVRNIPDPDATVPAKPIVRNVPDPDATVPAKPIERNPTNIWDEAAQRMIAERAKEKAFKVRPLDTGYKMEGRGLSQVLTSPVEKIAGRAVSTIESRLRIGKIVSRKPLSETGIASGVNDTFAVDLGDNIGGIWKPHRDKWSSNYRAEVLAYELDRAFGFNLVPPTVVRTIDGEIGSLQLFTKSKKDATPRIEAIQKQHAFDYLIDNRDRHSGNYLVREDGTVVSIDNGISFTGLGNWTVAMEKRMPHLRDFVRTAEGKQILSKIRTYVDDANFKKQLVDYLGEVDARKVIERMRFLLTVGDYFG